MWPFSIWNRIFGKKAGLRWQLNTKTFARNINKAPEIHMKSNCGCTQQKFQTTHVLIPVYFFPFDFSASSFPLSLSHLFIVCSHFFPLHSLVCACAKFCVTFFIAMYLATYDSSNCILWIVSRFGIFIRIQFLAQHLANIGKTRVP